MESLNKDEIISTEWIEGLALEEINMDESGVVNFNEHLDPIHFIEASSVQLMNEIRDRVEIYATKFNEYRGSADSGHGIRIFKISNTVNDFMLFRNSLRLIFARKKTDLLSIGFLGGGNDIYGARLTTTDSAGKQAPHEIKAHVGPFNNVSWRFQGEIVDLDSLVKHYMTEFIKSSAR